MFEVHTACMHGDHTDFSGQEAATSLFQYALSKCVFLDTGNKTFVSSVSNML